MNSTNVHYKALGLIEVIYGAIHVVAFLVIGSASLLGCAICAGGEGLGDVFGGLAWSAIYGTLGLGGAIISAIPIVAGLALANGRDWAKIATIVFALLVIAEFPLGTAFAVYAAWVIFFQKDRGYSW
jgi:hypothetical protein